MTEISLGRYWKGENPLSLLDSRTKLFSLILYIVTLFYFSSLVTLAFSAVFLIFVIAVSRIPIRYMTKGLLKPFILFLLFALLIVLFEENGFRRAFFMVSRLVLTVLSSSLLTLTTRPKDIAGGIEKALGKGILKKSVHTLATIIMIAFRFLPLLVDEAGRIADAQKSRGCSFEDKTIVGKCRASLPLLVPLFVSAFHRADELALAFDARGYSEKGGTRLYPMRYTAKDAWGYIMIILYAVLCLVLEKFLYV